MNRVQLEPLSESHIEGLEAVFKAEFTSFYPRPLASAREYYDEVVQKQVFGPCEVFAIRELTNGRLAGCTGYFNPSPENRRVEIGGTWLGLEFRGSAVNPESKLLLLTEAFEGRRCQRVEFKTDRLNIPSQRAMEKLGFVREGCLRKHMLLPNGRQRDSLYYSVIEEEWPQVRAGIAARIASLKA